MTAVRSDVAIVGAGPAGIAAAIQLKRSGVDFTLFERRRFGGLLHNANLVENYPGFPKGIPGPALVELLKRHLEEWKIEVQYADVTKLHWEKDEFQFEVDGASRESRFLVLATGTIPKEPPGIEKWMELSGSRCFLEVADLPRATNAHVTVLGGGDAAFDYALNLARRGHRVTINLRGRQPRCLALLEKRAAAHDGITIRSGRILRAVRERGERVELSWEDGDAGSSTEETDYVLAAVGRRVDLRYLAPSLRDKLEELEALRRLWRIGDVVQGRYRQTAVAVGDGIKAAMQIEERLRETDER